MKDQQGMVGDVSEGKGDKAWEMKTSRLVP